MADCTQRDPRIDPMPGDVLSFGLRRRIYVVDRGLSWPDTVHYTHRNHGAHHVAGSAYFASTHEWRRMMRHKDIAVEKVAKENDNG